MNRIKVTIFGNSYHISTPDSEEHIRKIERRIAQGLQAVTESRPGLSTLDAAALLCMNAMDENIKGGEAMDRMREQLSQYLEEAARARIDTEQAKNATHDAAAENDELREEIRRLTRERNQMAQEAALLREERFALASQMEIGEGKQDLYGDKKL